MSRASNWFRRGLQESAGRRFIPGATAVILVLPCLGGASPAGSGPITIGNLSSENGGLLIQWSGAFPPYQVEVRDDFSSPWRDVGSPTYNNWHVIEASAPSGFFRVRTIPDQVAPDVPLGLAASIVSSEQIALSWNPILCGGPACADNEGGSGLAGYRIYRNGVLVKEVFYPSNATLDSGLSPLTAYSYTITAVDKAGNESGHSYAVVFTTPVLNVLRNASAALGWDPNPEADIAGYTVRYGISSGSYTQSIDVGDVTMATVTGLTLGTTYYFVVSAYNTGGWESAVSSEVSYSPQ